MQRTTDFWTNGYPFTVTRKLGADHGAGAGERRRLVPRLRHRTSFI